MTLFLRPFILFFESDLLYNLAVYIIPICLFYSFCRILRSVF